MLRECSEGIFLRVVAGLGVRGQKSEVRSGLWLCGTLYTVLGTLKVNTLWFCEVSEV